MQFRILTSFALFCLAFGLMACGGSASDAPADTTPDTEQATNDAANDPTEAREFSEMWDSVMAQHDADAMAAMFTDDAVRLDMDAPLRVGKDAIRAEFVPMFETSTYETDNPVDDIVVVGDWGWARGTYDDTRTNKEMGESTRVTGKWMTILRKTADGWKYALDAGNENEVGATGAGPESLELPPEEGKTSGDPADVEAVREMIAIWQAAAENADQRESFVMTFAADGVRMNDDAPTDIGHDAIRERWMAGFIEGESETALTFDVIEVVGDWAWVRGHWGVATTAADGTVSRQVGKYVNVCKRTADGWKVQVNLWNQNAPPAPLPEA